jgi:hypothetical protein
MPSEPNSPSEEQIIKAAPGEEGIKPDALSLEEEKHFARTAQRQEQIRESVHWGMILFIRVAIVLTTLVFILRVLQFVLPTSWRWLSDEQTHDIDKLLFGGAYGAFIARYLRSAIFPDRKP